MLALPFEGQCVWFTSPRTDFPAPSRPRAPFDFPQDERGPNRSGHPELVEWAPSVGMVRVPHRERTSRPHPGPVRPSISLRTNGPPTAPATPSLSNGPSRSNGSRASPRTDFPAPSRPRAPFDFPQDERGPNRSGHPELVDGPRPFEWFESLTTNGLPGPIPAPCALRFPSGRTGPQPLRPP